jgi:hypothetical protein
MVVPLKATKTPFCFRNLFSSILFADEKDNFLKSSNPRTLGYKGGF